MPVLEKTWQFNVNQDLNTTGGYFNDRRQLMRTIKDSMIGFAQSPWTVVGSSDGVTGALDAVDRWIDNGDLIFNTDGNAHSWIVLEQAGMGGFQVLLACEGFTNADVARVHFSVGGNFTGGSNTLDPTASDRRTLSTGGKWYKGYNLSTFSTALHVMQTTDGSATRIIACDSPNSIGMFMQFEEVAEPQAGWSAPYVATLSGQESGSKLDYATLHNTGGTDKVAGYNESGKLGFYYATECVGNDALGETGSLQGANAIDGNYLLTPIWLVSETASRKGMYGRLRDIWMGVSGNAHGETYPAVGDIEFVQFQDLVLPWPNLTPLLG